MRTPFHSKTLNSNRGGGVALQKRRIKRALGMAPSRRLSHEGDKLRASLADKGGPSKTGTRQLLALGSSKRHTRQRGR